MSHTVKLKVYVFRYVSNTPAIKGEPHYTLFTHMTTSSDWVFIREVEVETTDHTSEDELIQATVAVIDREIQTKRMDLEHDLKELNDRKKDLLSLTYEVQS